MRQVFAHVVLHPPERLLVPHIADMMTICKNVVDDD
jgi:hypothetical protein